jgi:photosystem II stability/assembly factor-like uncharacterized protein/cytoskeletal protein CcmA (bactofilin family)
MKDNRRHIFFRYVPATVILSIVLALLVLAPAAGASQPWNWVHQGNGSGATLFGASFVNGDTGWVSGDNGKVLKTTNGGQSWTSDASGIPSDVVVHDVHFLNNSTGFAVGCQGASCTSSGVNGRVYKYSSGTWTAMNIPGDTKALVTVHMVDASHGWAAGEDGEVLKTVNGTDWSRANTGMTADYTINSIDAVTSTAVWAAGQDISGGSPGEGAIFKYNNGSGSWSKLIPTSAPGFLTSIDMVDTGTGYAVGGVDKAYKTTDGGSNWVLLDTGLSGTMVPPIITDISFIDQNVGFLSDRGKVVTTVNGGQTWTEETAGSSSTVLNTVTTTVDDASGKVTTYVAGADESVLKQVIYVNPFGSFDSASAAGSTGKINVSGWAIDPNAGTGSIDVHFYVNGQFKGAITADQSRPDIGAAYPAYGANHGFSGQLDAVATSNTVCAYGINKPGSPGGNVLLGCRAVSVQVNPFGSFDSAYADSANGKLNVSGWAIDPNAGTGSTDVHFYVNGQFKGAITADGSRADLDAIFPYGPNHGFSGQIDNAGTGNNTICAYGINTGAGGNVLLGCRVVNVPTGNPFGSFDGASDASFGKINVSGWAIDPNAGTGSIDAHFYVNGVFKGALTADGSRSDLDAIFPYGPSHGFSGQIDAVATSNTVCAYGINKPGSPGGNVLLGCRAVSVQVNPFGSLDGTSAAVDVYGLSTGKLDVSGWAIDPNAGTGSIDVHFYVNGQFKGAITADVSRADLDALFPYGPNHGFSGQIDVAAYNAVNTVCAYGFNTGAGGNVLLGCRAVSVPPPA